MRKIHSKVIELDGHTLKKYGSANVISLFNNDVSRINSLIVTFSTQFDYKLSWVAV